MVLTVLQRAMLFLVVTTGTCDLVDVYALNLWILVMHIRKNIYNSSLELIVNIVCLYKPLKEKYKFMEYNKLQAHFRPIAGYMKVVQAISICS